LDIEGKRKIYKDIDAVSGKNAPECLFLNGKHFIMHYEIEGGRMPYRQTV
jgi:hypothetical protein